MNLQLNCIQDFERFALMIREDELTKQRIANDVFRHQVEKIGLLHKALYDQGNASESASASLQNLKLGSGTESAFNDDQRQLIAERYTLLLLHICDTLPPTK